MGKRAIIAMVAMGLLAGCGSSSSGGGTAPTFTTSVAGTTSLGTLSGTQLTTLCSDLDKYGKTLASNPTIKQGSCKASGLVAAALLAAFGAPDSEIQMACTMTVSQCNAAPAQPKSVTCSVPPPSTCTATVAQYTACLNDSIAATEAAFNAIPSCNSLTGATLNADGGIPGSNPTPPASCTAFETACPSTGDLPNPSFSASP